MYVFLTINSAKEFRSDLTTIVLQDHKFSLTAITSSSEIRFRANFKFLLRRTLKLVVTAYI